VEEEGSREEAGHRQREDEEERGSFQDGSGNGEGERKHRWGRERGIEREKNQDGKRCSRPGMFFEAGREEEKLTSPMKCSVESDPALEPVHDLLLSIIVLHFLRPHFLSTEEISRCQDKESSESGGRKDQDLVSKVFLFRRLEVVIAGWPSPCVDEEDSDRGEDKVKESSKTGGERHHGVEKKR